MYKILDAPLPRTLPAHECTSALLRAGGHRPESTPNPGRWREGGAPQSASESDGGLTTAGRLPHQQPSGFGVLPCALCGKPTQQQKRGNSSEPPTRNATQTKINSKMIARQ